MSEPRFTTLTPETMTADQKRLADAIQSGPGASGCVSMPLTVGQWRLRAGVAPPLKWGGISRWAKRLAARDRLPSAPRVSARGVVPAPALLGGAGLTACSSPPPAPPRQPAVVETSVSTRYYPVLGTTAPAIFTAIDASSPVQTSGQRAVGMTSAEWKLTSDDGDVRAVPCV